LPTIHRGYLYYNNGQKYDGATGSAYGAAYTVNDVIGVAFDADSGTLTFYKNGISQGAAFSGLSAGNYAPLITDGNSSTQIGASVNFGQAPLHAAATFQSAAGGYFNYAPPSGYKALCQSNLTTPSIQNPSKHFDVNSYSGNSTNNRVITGLKNGVSNFAWIKNRSNANNHQLYDSTRGVTKSISSNDPAAEVTLSEFSSFDDGAVTLGTWDARTNQTGYNYILWSWKAAGSATSSSNSVGSITSQVSSNTTAGFSVVTYTGTGANATVGHGLGAAPKMIIVKCTNTASTPWAVWHTSIANTEYLYLNTTNAKATGVALWNSTSPTSSVFSVGNAQDTNYTTKSFVAYVFAEIPGYSKFGSYVGNGSTDGPFAYCGFKPKYILIKCSSNSTASTVWTVYDTSRDIFNASTHEITANSSVIEAVDASGCDILSSGFKPRRNSEYLNTNGWTYIFYAVADVPFKYSNAR
jgi:hypothetical protein